MPGDAEQLHIGGGRWFMSWVMMERCVVMAPVMNLMSRERNSVTVVMKVGVECDGGGGGCWEWVCEGDEWLEGRIRN